MDIKNELIEKYQVRKSKKQKQLFADYVKKIAKSNNLPVKEEYTPGLVTSCNLIVGEPDKADVIFTAHYDTCAAAPFPNFVMPTNFFSFLLSQIILLVVVLGVPFLLGVVVFMITGSAPNGITVWYVLFLLLVIQMMCGIPNPHTANDNTSGIAVLLYIMTTMPQDAKLKPAFVFFDNEELGLVGSSGFFKAHKKHMRTKLVINFDCVGDGNTIFTVFKRQTQKDPMAAAFIDSLTACTQKRGKSMLCKKSTSAIYPSDQMRFPNSIGIAALRRNPLLGYYMGRIHTPWDTVCDDGNLELITEAAIHLLTNYENHTNA